MLFSEPKIPQCALGTDATLPEVAFQCSSASRKFLNSATALRTPAPRAGFSALQRAENSSIALIRSCDPSARYRFSALQRAENSSILTHFALVTARPGFSALQRAENSSIFTMRRWLSYPRRCVSVLFSEPKIPQSDSADAWSADRRGFSALQRAENSSIRLRGSATTLDANVSVLFSEPKIPQSLILPVLNLSRTVSVLFSEPKIPQLETGTLERSRDHGFSALQRAENSSIHNIRPVPEYISGFSALQRAENSSISVSRWQHSDLARVSVLFSEPKIPQLGCCCRRSRHHACFSALQRAENSSILNPTRQCGRAWRFQCSSASRKFLNPSSARRGAAGARVSVLFSEPKIPQSVSQIITYSRLCCFSALQRAENSSISGIVDVIRYGERFSALQRAENSSICSRRIR